MSQSDNTKKFQFTTTGASVDPVFTSKGDGWTASLSHGKEGSPLHHVLASVSTCLLMTFQAIAEKEGFDYLEVKSDGECTVDTSARPWKVQSVDLNIQFEVPKVNDTIQKKLEELVGIAEKKCFISSLITQAGVSVHVTPRAVKAIE